MTLLLKSWPSIALLLALALFQSSCDKPIDEIPEINPPTLAPPCVFEAQENSTDGYIDDAERSWMMACSESAYTLEEDIRASLLGEWELVGNGEGWLPTLTQPCGNITFEETTLVFDFENEWVDTTLTTNWDLDSTFHLNVKAFKLVTDIDFSDALDLRVFCEDYIFHDATPSDGNMYIYRRI